MEFAPVRFYYNLRVTLIDVEYIGPAIAQYHLDLVCVPFLSCTNPSETHIV